MTVNQLLNGVRRKLMNGHTFKSNDRNVMVNFKPGEYVRKMFI